MQLFDPLQFLAIQGLHKFGIIHRDLKPENILFGGDGHLVLADYGVATVLVLDEEDAFMEDEFPLWAESKERGGDDFPLLTPSVDNPHTVVGVSGTVYYTAPEVIEGKEYSYGVDYYSMAMLYHEMVTGYVSPPVFLFFFFLLTTFLGPSPTRIFKARYR